MSSSSSQNSPEPRGPLDILFSIFSGALIGLFLSNLRAPIQDSSKTIHPQDTPEPEGQSGQARFGGSLVVHPPTDPPKSDNGSGKKTPGWEKAAVLIALGLLIANWYQGCQTKKAANSARDGVDLARQTSRLDQRAWVSVHVASGIPQLNKIMPVIASMTNSGRTFAVNMRVCQLGDFTNNDAAYREPSHIPKFRDCSETDFTAPNIVAPTTTVNHEASVTAPNDLTAGLNAMQVEWLTNGKTILWHFGKVTYDDFAGKPHWVQYCYYRVVAEGGEVRWETCNTGNNIDRDNP